VRRHLKHISAVLGRLGGVFSGTYGMIAAIAAWFGAPVGGILGFAVGHSRHVTTTLPVAGESNVVTETVHASTRVPWALVGVGVWLLVLLLIVTVRLQSELDGNDRPTPSVVNNYNIYLGAGGGAEPPSSAVGGGGSVTPSGLLLPPYTRDKDAGGEG